MPNKFQFTFTVSGLDEARCDVLIQGILNFVEVSGGEVVGGFSEVKDEQEEPGSTENGD